ncbi:hypothetical protein MG1601_267 [Mycoplasmoides gallisepticum]|uniref:Uncharacterized protein n=2 Tax=Mycoplasmoidales TaxID=2790996 RepID=A0A3B0PS90_MYCGL|nr:Uncharacterised protein [Mycoplasmoides gallisepticum]
MEKMLEVKNQIEIINTIKRKKALKISVNSNAVLSLRIFTNLFEKI